VFELQKWTEMSAPYKAKVHIPWLKNIGGKTYTLKLDLENPKPFGVRGATAENRARGDVGRAGGREPHNHSHWPRWMRGRARGQMQKISAGKFPFEPPFTSFDHLVGAGEQRIRHR
jgi:hypothetical protein